MNVAPRFRLHVDLRRQASAICR
ncbi:putative leader peptide [Actinosynnema sp. NPDC051121]